LERGNMLVKYFCSATPAIRLRSLHRRDTRYVLTMQL
jgi:hypothetical protein